MCTPVSLLTVLVLLRLREFYNYGSLSATHVGIGMQSGACLTLHGRYFFTNASPFLSEVLRNRRKSFHVGQVFISGNDSKESLFTIDVWCDRSYLQPLHLNTGAVGSIPVSLHAELKVNI